MKSAELEKVYRETPEYYPVFRAVNVPYWARQLGVKTGDISGEYGTFNGCSLGASSMTFIGYKKKEV